MSEQYDFAALRSFPTALARAQAGDTLAMGKVAYQYVSGEGGATRNVRAAEYWYRLADVVTKHRGYVGFDRASFLARSHGGKAPRMAEALTVWGKLGTGDYWAQTTAAESYVRAAMRGLVTGQNDLDTRAKVSLGLAQARMRAFLNKKQRARQERLVVAPLAHGGVTITRPGHPLWQDLKLTISPASGTEPVTARQKELSQLRETTHDGARIRMRDARADQFERAATLCSDMLQVRDLAHPPQYAMAAMPSGTISMTRADDEWQGIKVTIGPASPKPRAHRLRPGLYRG